MTRAVAQGGLETESELTHEQYLVRLSPPKPVMIMKAALRPGESLFFRWGHRGLWRSFQDEGQMMGLEVRALGELDRLLGQVSGPRFS